MSGPPYHGRTHGPDGTDPIPNGIIDSTENVGDEFGVHSVEPDSDFEDENSLLTADGEGGSRWSPVPQGILAGCPTVELAYRTPGDLTAWWRLGDSFVFATNVVGALDDVAGFDGSSPRKLDYTETFSSERPTLQIADPDLGTGDDGAIQFNSTVFTDGQWFTKTSGSAVPNVTKFGQSADLARSVVCRIKPNNTLTSFEQPYVGIWGMDAGGAYNLGWIIDVTSLTLRFKNHNAIPASGTNFELATQAPLTAGTWYSVAVTWDGATWLLYLDGVLVDTHASAVAPGNPSSGNASFALGYGVYDQGVSDRPHYCNGGIDEVAFYKKVLSAAEIATIAQSSGSGTSAFFCAGSVDSTENVGYEFGVRSEGEAADLVLTSDGTGGSEWAVVSVDGGSP